MLATSVRVSPCRAAALPLVVGTLTSSVPSSSRSMVMGSATVWVSVPLGPFTVTVLAVDGDLDAGGTGIGRRPMRDMSARSSYQT